MNSKQIDLLVKRFIHDSQKYRGNEPEDVKRSNDLIFCKAFFNKDEVDLDLVKILLGGSFVITNVLRL